MKVRDVIRLIEQDGWRYHSTRGSHRQFTHPVKPGRVTVPGKPSDEMYAGMLASIFAQAKMEKPR
ncbi:MAG: type II toxin-antitoxin system HicA family toxin [Bryobacteraceae bacterium]